MSTLLILAALVATLVAGCGGAGSGGSSQAPEEQASRSASPSEQKTEGTGSSGQRLGHPALGDVDAPVVLTEYADYQ
jgi:protein-disulfide isomerase